MSVHADVPTENDVHAHALVHNVRANTDVDLYDDIVVEHVEELHGNVHDVGLLADTVAEPVGASIQ